MNQAFAQSELSKMRQLHEGDCPVCQKPYVKKYLDRNIVRFKHRRLMKSGSDVFKDRYVKTYYCERSIK